MKLHIIILTFLLFLNYSKSNSANGSLEKSEFTIDQSLTSNSLLTKNATNKTKLNTLKITSKEQAWLDQNITIRYVYDPDWAPFEWTNDVNQHAGIIADLLRLIKTKSGLNLVPIKSKSWAEAIEYAKKRHADMYSGVGITEERIRYMNFTDKNIFSTPYIFVGRHGEDYLKGFDSLKNKKIALVDGYTIHGIIKQNRPDLPLVLLKGTQEGFDKLLNNEIDIFLVNTVTAKYYIAQERYQSLNLAYQTEYSLNLKVAVRNDWMPKIAYECGAVDKQLSLEAVVHTINSLV